MAFYSPCKDPIMQIAVPLRIRISMVDGVPMKKGHIPQIGVALVLKVVSYHGNFVFQESS